MSNYKINPENENLSIKVLMERIEKGYELQEIDGKLEDKDILKFNGAIILTPDYQREYRFTLEDEVKLIESVLVGIPIPPIFLATDKLQEVRVTNVVDGQHRLRALHRFYNNDFTLNGIKLLTGLNGKKFDDLNIDLKSDFMEHTFLVTIFKDFPGKDFELEIFNRYNKGTKPLSPQEIRHAVYNSEFNRYINSFTLNLFKNKSLEEANTFLKKAYNVTKDRIQKKKVQEGMFVILSILENGINENYEKSLIYAENFMKEKAKLEEEDSKLLETNFEQVKKTFIQFNHFIFELKEKCEYPFSKELYGISSRNYKFQISIAMVLAGIFNKISHDNDTFKTFIEQDNYRNNFMQIIKNNLLESFLEDPNYNASSTNSRELNKLVNSIFDQLLTFSKNLT